MLNYFFKKQFRLLHSQSFQDVFSHAYKHQTSEINILGRVNSLNYPRLGLSVSRKNIKYAYNRNTIKRLIRETFRILQHKLIYMDFVVIAKKGIINLNNNQIINMLNILWSYYYR